MQRFYPVNTNKNVHTLKVPSNTLATRDFSIALLWSSSRRVYRKTRESLEKHVFVGKHAFIGKHMRDHAREKRLF